MNVRRIRQLLWTLGLLLFAGSIAALALGIALPCHAEKASHSLAGSTQPSPLSHRQLPTLERFEPIMALDLRRPLYDAPPPPTVVAQAPEPPPLTLRLAGTIIEPGRSVAILLTAEGKIELKAVGETSGGAQVLAIEPDAVTVLFNGQNLTLKIEKAGQQG